MNHRAYVVSLPDTHRVLCSCGWSREFSNYAEAWEWADYHPRSLEVVYPVPPGATRGFVDG